MWYTNRMEDLVDYPGLYPRGNIWYVRKRITTDIRDQYPPNKSEVKKSLKTEDRKKAIQLYHQAMAAIESKFETERLKKNNPQAHDLLSTYDDAGILGLVYDWYTETSERLEKIEARNTTVYDSEDTKNAILESHQELQDSEDAMNQKNYEIIHQDVQRWLKKRDITYTVGSPTYQQFCYYFIRADIFLLQKSLAEMKGKSFKALPDIFTQKFKHAPTSQTTNGFNTCKGINKRIKNNRIIIRLKSLTFVHIA